nr:hypothetical protein [Planctomycetota bacterium]
FTPTDTAHQPVTATVSLRVLRATPVVQWAKPADITYGTGLSGIQLNATASVAGTMTYSPPAGSIVPAGTRPLVAVFIPTDTANHVPVTATVELTVHPATPALSWARPAAIAVGTALSATQLDARSPVEGTFDYTPAVGEVLPAGAHALRAVFTPTDTENYIGGGVVTTQLDVRKVRPTITWTAPADITYGIALGVQQLNAVASVPGTFAYDPVAGTILPAGSRTLTVVFTPSDLANNESGIASQVTINVRKAQPQVTWATPAPFTFGAALTTLQLSATSTVAGDIAYDPPLGFLLPVGEHVLVATLTPADAVNRLPAEASVVQRVLAGPVSITWNTPDPITYGTPLDERQLNAVCDQPGTLAYQPAAGALLEPGPQTLRVNWTPAGAFQPMSAMVRLLVRKRAPELTWAPPADAAYGTPMSSTQMSAQASVPGTFTYEPLAGTVLDGGVHRLRSRFAPADLTRYLSDLTVETTWRITPAQPVLTWTDPAAIDAGVRLSPVQLNATSSAPGTMAYSPGSGTQLPAGTHVLRATFSPTNPANHTVAEITASLVVRPSTPVITWPQPAPYRYPATLTESSLNATAAVPGTMTYDRSVGTLLPPGDHVIRATFTPTDGASYGTASMQRTIRVLRGVPTVTWAVPAPILEGTALGGDQLNAAGSAPGSMAYAPGSGAILPIGDHPLEVVFTPTDLALWEPASASVSLKVLSGNPVVTWVAPQPITYGTGLGAAQLRATCEMPGTFVYTPAAGELLPAGAHTLRCVFTPDPRFPVAPVAASVPLQVDKAKPQIAWPQIAPLVYPSPLTAVRLNAQATAMVLGVTTSVTGRYAYTPRAGTIPPIGRLALRVDFAPQDEDNFMPASADNGIDILSYDPEPDSEEEDGIAPSDGIAFDLDGSGSGGGG